MDKKVHRLLSGAGLGDILIPRKKFIEEHNHLISLLRESDKPRLLAEARDQSKELNQVLSGGSWQSGFIARMMGENRIKNKGTYKPASSLPDGSKMKDAVHFQFAKMKKASPFINRHFKEGEEFVRKRGLKETLASEPFQKDFYAEKKNRPAKSKLKIGTPTGNTVGTNPPLKEIYWKSRQFLYKSPSGGLFQKQKTGRFKYSMVKVGNVGEGDYSILKGGRFDDEYADFGGDDALKQIMLTVITVARDLGWRDVSRIRRHLQLFIPPIEPNDVDYLAQYILTHLEREDAQRMEAGIRGFGRGGVSVVIPTAEMNHDILVTYHQARRTRWDAQRIRRYINEMMIDQYTPLQVDYMVDKVQQYLDGDVEE